MILLNRKEDKMIKILKNLGKREWIMMVVCAVLVAAQVWLELKMPDYMSEITVLVQTEGSQMQDILKNGAYMLACALRKLIICSCCGVYSIRDSSDSFNES